MSGKETLLQIPISDLNDIVVRVGNRWEKLRGQRLLLTGATGFIGKWMLASFLRANRELGLSAKVVALSRRPEAFLNQFPDLRNDPDLVWLTGDVRDLASQVAGDCGFAIHAATDVAATNSPNEILDTCIQGTYRLLQAMSKVDRVRRILLLSSGAVYGSPIHKIKRIPEDWDGAPNSLDSASAYGEGKRVSELLSVLASASQPQTEVAIARCFAFVGPHLAFDKHFAIGNFIGAAINGEDIHISGDGTPLRSYLYAADLARWLWVMLFDAPSGRAYNVGSDQSCSIRELAYRVNRVLGGCGQVRIAKKACEGVVPSCYVPSIDRISSELNLVPTVTLDEAIIRTARWAMRQG